MNKLSLLFYFILIFNYSYSINLPTLNAETIYEYLIGIVKGLSISEDYQCEGVFLKNKEAILKILKDFIQEVKGGKDFRNLIIPYGIKAFMIPDLISKCQMLPILDLYNKISTKEGFKDIGSCLYYNSDKIEELIGKLRNEKEKEKKLENIGKLLSIVLNFYVK